MTGIPLIWFIVLFDVRPLTIEAEGYGRRVKDCGVAKGKLVSTWVCRLRLFGNSLLLSAVSYHSNTHRHSFLCLSVSPFTGFTNLNIACDMARFHLQR